MLTHLNNVDLLENICLRYRIKSLKNMSNTYKSLDTFGP